MNCESSARVGSSLPHPLNSSNRLRAIAIGLSLGFSLLLRSMDVRTSLGTPSSNIASGMASAVVTRASNDSCSSLSLPETVDMLPFRSRKKRGPIINSRGRCIVSGGLRPTLDTSPSKLNTLDGSTSETRLGMYRTTKPSSTTRATPVSGST